MKSFNISALYLFSSLFIFIFISISASQDSILRQSTDELISTDLQLRTRAVPIKEHVNDGESYMGALRITATGMRSLPPSSYSLKFESFNTLLRSVSADRYESRPFTVGGHNWSLIVYPNGNKAHYGGGYISLYVKIDNATLPARPQAVYADLRFYIFNQFQRKYYTVQDTDVLPFDSFKTMWGFPQVLSLSTFTNYNNGYLFNGGECEFGVDVFVPTASNKSEIFTVATKFQNRRFTWNIRGFSKLVGDSYLSDEFVIGGRRWQIQVYPNGRNTEQGRSLSMFLNLSPNEILRSYERIYVGAKLRVVNQRGYQNIDGQIDAWFNGRGYGEGYGWGWENFTPLSNLRDSSRGFVVSDTLVVQVDMESISSTTYLPN